jgi:hypothetical protein
VSPGTNGEKRLPDTLRAYRYTTIYIGIAVTAVLALLLWDLFGGPTPSVCSTAAAISQGVIAL